MGSLFAALLTQDNANNVCLLDYNRKRAKQITFRGLRVKGLTSLCVQPGRVLATADARKVGKADIVIIMVKSPDTQEATKRVKHCVGTRTLVISLQNGLGNVEVIKKVLGKTYAGNVAGGTTAQGATLLCPGIVRHAGRGVTVLEKSTRREIQVNALGKALVRAGLPVKLVGDLAPWTWSKLVINSAINPLGAVFGVPNGELARIPAYRLLLGLVARESAQVARAAGIRLRYRDAEAETIRVCQATAKNRNSMLQDVLRGKPTEIEAINGVIVETARRKGIKAPLNEMLVEMVKRLKRLK